MKKKLTKRIKALDIKTNYKKYITVIYVLLVMVPIMIGLSLSVGRTDDVVAKSIANILLLVLFVVFFIYDFRKKVAEDWGLVTLKVSERCYDEAVEDMKKAHSIKMVMSSDLAGMYKLIEETPCDSTCTYEVLMMNPYSEFAKFCKEDVALWAEKLETLAAHSSKNISIKHYSMPPVDNFILVDDNVVYIYPITQKLNDGRRMCKSFRGKKKGTKIYVDIFSRLWKNPIYGGRV